MNENELGGFPELAMDDDCGCGGQGDSLAPLFAELDAVGAEDPGGELPEIETLEAELSALEAGETGEEFDLAAGEALDLSTLEEELEFAAAGGGEQNTDVALEDILALVEKYPGLQIGISFR